MHTLLYKCQYVYKLLYVCILIHVFFMYIYHHHVVLLAWISLSLAICL